MQFDSGCPKSPGSPRSPDTAEEQTSAAVPECSLPPYSGLRFVFQGDLGPFNPGLPVEVPVWLAVSLKQRQKCRLVPPEWMDVGKDDGFSPGKHDVNKKKTISDFHH